MAGLSDRDKRIITLWESGVNGRRPTLTWIAGQVGTSRQQVSGLLKREGLRESQPQRSHHPVTVAERNAIVALYPRRLGRQSQSIKAVARQTGRCPETVERIVREAGIKRRPGDAGWTVCVYRWTGSRYRKVIHRDGRHLDPGEVKDTDVVVRLGPRRIEVDPAAERPRRATAS